METRTFFTPKKPSTESENFQMDNMFSRQDEEAQLAVQFGLMAVQDRIGTQNRILISQQQQLEDIQQLKADVARKDEEINSLRQELRDLEQKNCELENALTLRNGEIKGLKDRIQKLEKEKRGLEDELAMVQKKVSRLEGEIDSLTASKDKQEEHNQLVQEKLGKADVNLARVKVELAQTKHENRILQKEIKEVKEAQQKSFSLTTRARPLQFSTPLEFQPISENAAVLYLGELCYQVQSQMYKAVLPKHFTPIRSYKVKSLLKDLQKLPKDEKEKQEAEQKWENLKMKLNWKDEYEDAMKSLQESRNREAHPQLTEEILQKAVEELDKRKALKGYLSVEFVESLIDMWKTLTQH